MREQRPWKPTNGRPEASGDAPAELAAHISHHFERPWLPPLDGGAGELPGGQRRQPSKTQKLLLNASSPALSKDLSGLQKVSQLNFAFCRSFSLPRAALRNFVGLLSSFSEAFVGWISGKDFTISRELLGSQPPPPTPTKLWACL